jgi:predicted nucleotidyltransferase
MKTIKNPNDIVEKLIADFSQAFGEKLISVILYGSAVSHEYRPGKSDINVAVILSDNEVSTISQITPYMNYWSKRGLATPFFMTKSYITESLDTFPIEFLDIKNAHRVLFGEDILSGLEIQREHLRLQCERELRGTSLHLRKAYIHSIKKPEALLDIIHISIRHLIPIFRALLVLEQRNIPATRADVVGLVEDSFNLEGGSLSCLFTQSIADVKKNGQVVFDRYAKAIDALIKSIDALK